MKLRGLLSNISFAAQEHSPELLLIAGSVSFIATVVTACTKVPKFEKVIQRHNEWLESTKKAKEIAENPENPEEVEYTDEDYKSDRMGGYVRTAVDTVKTFAVPLMLGGISMYCFMKASGIWKGRYAGAAAAFTAAISREKFLEGRIIEEFGHEKLQELKMGKLKEVVETVEDPETGEVKTTVTKKLDPNEVQPYSFFFCESNPNWSKDPEANKMWLYAKQNYWNARLAAVGHVFLNEVLEDLGEQITQEGQFIGWKYYKDKKEAEENGSDNFIDFGIFNTTSGAGIRFINGLESVVILNMNVDKQPIIRRIGLPVGHPKGREE